MWIVIVIDLYLWTIFRLQDYDRNRDFTGELFIVPPPVCVDWPTAGFSQVLEKDDVPAISDQHIEAYFVHRMCLDRRAAGDTKAVEKGKLLLDSRRIKACSLLTEGDNFYLSGMCQASMKKGVRLKNMMGLFQNYPNDWPNNLFSVWTWYIRITKF